VDYIAGDVEDTGLHTHASRIAGAQGDVSWLGSAEEAADCIADAGRYCMGAGRVCMDGIADGEETLTFERVLARLRVLAGTGTLDETQGTLAMSQALGNYTGRVGGFLCEFRGHRGRLGSYRWRWNLRRLL